VQVDKYQLFPFIIALLPPTKSPVAAAMSDFEPG
jgi:hypothetical protein